ncbi:MAG: transposase [Spirochaetia bacterium]|nr:transposase [Spirochaetia bacterium]
MTLDDISYKQQVQRREIARQAINPEYFQRVAESFMDSLYPCVCKKCGVVCSGRVRNRVARARCPQCHQQRSRFGHTPLRNFKLPLWTFGWAVEESLIRHPKVLTATEIQKRVGISYPSALLLKRRIQLLASDQNETVRAIVRADLGREFKKFRLPPEGRDVKKKVQGRSVVYADTMVLFSASQRANKGRKRHRHRGLTSSIYLSDKLGGKQIGTLVHVMGTKRGWCLLDSVSDQKAATLGSIIKATIPHNVPFFTDEGYKWLYRVYPNHRMVNHSAKSRDIRCALSGERWCKKGVHNQVAEGLNGSLKSAFRGYGYVTPRWSKMYLNEWAFFKNYRVFGIQRIAKHRERMRRTQSLYGIRRRPFPL